MVRNIDYCSMRMTLQSCWMVLKYHWSQHCLSWISLQSFPDWNQTTTRLAVLELGSLKNENLVFQDNYRIQWSQEPFSFLGITFTDYLSKDKKEEIWPSPMTKAPIPTEISKGQSSNTNNVTKSSIKQQLRTDLGRSVGVTTATQLVWLTGLRAHLPTPRNSRVIKRTHI